MKRFWYLVKVSYRKIDERSGKDMKTIEAYLVDAVNFTDAEARFMKQAESLFSVEFRIVDIRFANYTDVLFPFLADNVYKVKISFISVDDKSGKESRVSNYLLIPADSVVEACNACDKHLADMIVPYNISAVAESPIIDAFPYIENKE